jgi:hypothetical protein
MGAFVGVEEVTFSVGCGVGLNVMTIAAGAGVGSSTGDAVGRKPVALYGLILGVATGSTVGGKITVSDTEEGLIVQDKVGVRVGEVKVGEADGRLDFVLSVLAGVLVIGGVLALFVADGVAGAKVVAVVGTLDRTIVDPLAA